MSNSTVANGSREGRSLDEQLYHCPLKDSKEPHPECNWEKSKCWKLVRRHIKRVHIKHMACPGQECTRRFGGKYELRRHRESNGASACPSSEDLNLPIPDLIHKLAEKKFEDFRTLESFQKGFLLPGGEVLYDYLRQKPTYTSTGPGLLHAEAPGHAGPTTDAGLTVGPTVDVNAGPMGVEPVIGAVEVDDSIDVDCPNMEVTFYSPVVVNSTPENGFLGFPVTDSADGLPQTIMQRAIERLNEPVVLSGIFADWASQDSAVLPIVIPIDSEASPNI